jgi:hypothetical protein
MPGVNFLARVYGPAVWYGANESICDVPRQLVKIHLYVPSNTPFTDLERLAQRLRGFYLSDRNTPIFGLLTKAFFRLAPSSFDDTPVTSMAPYSSRQSDQYPNEESCDWMFEYVQRTLPTFDMKKFMTFVAKAKTQSAFLKMPLCMEPEPIKQASVPLVVNGNDVPAIKVQTPALSQTKDMRNKPPFSEAELARMRTLPCRLVSQPGGCKFGQRCRYKHPEP